MVDEYGGILGDIDCWGGDVFIFDVWWECFDGVYEFCDYRYFWLW